MDVSELKPIIEAMIFVAEEPLTEGAIATALEQEGADKETVRECLVSLENEWNCDPSRGIGLAQVAGGYQFRTKAALAEWLKRLNVPKPMRLSGPALETLAIIAYRQPIVRSEIERIRGVDSGGVLKTLLERRLLHIVGRQDEPGQPLLYGTTKDFLEIFSLKGLTELPTLKDIEDLMRERRTVTENRQSEMESLAGDPEYEQTDAAEGEEETEVIRRRPLEENIKEEEKDMEALSNLEDSLKGLRRLERGIFPKMPDEDVAKDGEGGGHGEGKIEAGAEADAAGSDAFGPDDRPFE
ncbi:MAG: SMC-Scp complex subunit ScpB [Pseudomonadota bacterium]